MGEYVGALKDISAIDLGAIAAQRRTRNNRRRAPKKSITPLSVTHCKLPAMRSMARGTSR